MKRQISLIMIAITVYLVWTFATYIFEGRINLLHRDDPLGRFEYSVIVNMIIGTVVAILAIKPFIIASDQLSLSQIGFRSVKNTVALVAVAGTIGFLLFVIQGPASLNPIVISNVFSQTLPTSIAEVVVCWAVIGTSMESFSKNRLGKKISVMVGIIISTVLFGVYHFAHSEPFNQVNMVLILMLPGLLTSIVYFVGRNIYATIVFHNFQALFGVVASVEIAHVLQIQFPVVFLAVASVLVLIIMDRLILKKQIAFWDGK
ncbi:MAG TPA: CPBP family intramembrane glutamic endopeptidase [Candidatus Nitrosocosmicus sp.]|nr:CPBP family intramembrane glutamic endopeptidase [Candidatus Nitrosocosmicus sp.]